jgi:hyperosmotically inducible protein
MDKRVSILAVIAIGSGLLTLPARLPAQSNIKTTVPQNDHMDPWTRGPADESELTQKVRHSLLMLPYYGVFDDLGFRVNGATVTLLGQVTRPSLKDDAGSAVEKVPGVDAVVNSIEVLPLSPGDDQIRRAVYRAVYGDPSLSTRYAYSATPAIHIIVKNGNVRLEGVVTTTMDKNIAGIRANGVQGAFAVENALKVDGK